jgi:hypothetical protein
MPSRRTRQRLASHDRVPGVQFWPSPGLHPAGHFRYAIDYLLKPFSDERFEGDHGSRRHSHG